uniref:Putative secreted protein n=1 Tax=Rhipicephalus microplus TaxID=6941 RepID=A0A6M2DBR3_RHIMP
MHWCSVMLLILSVLYTEAADNQLGDVDRVVSDIFNNIVTVVDAAIKEIAGLFGLGPPVRALTPLKVVPA